MTTRDLPVDEEKIIIEATLIAIVPGMNAFNYINKCFMVQLHLYIL